MACGPRNDDGRDHNAGNECRKKRNDQKPDDVRGGRLGFIHFYGQRQRPGRARIADRNRGQHAQYDLAGLDGGASVGIGFSLSDGRKDLLNVHRLPVHYVRADGRGVGMEEVGTAV
ncbi:hypothetical protein SDC9_204158 [bioreactor metagenome]|uniref:Uncharacterized protein n=1 Tax=bioreactor metagenome TaxID=1076179 RepID=A0A645IYH9_9ZZZZ